MVQDRFWLFIAEGVKQKTHNNSSAGKKLEDHDGMQSQFNL